MRDLAHRDVAGFGRKGRDCESAAAACEQQGGEHCGDPLGVLLDALGQSFKQCLAGSVQAVSQWSIPRIC
ncbi:hypothetical protein GCM10023090_16430 [Acidovorax lacteus]|uniref:Uncharacterized protein n=1 Tax=Acidovorax lacteus TaxID=1924988 RepID=A0ABP8L7N3_9BURK